jgi:hypothetical protein
MRTATTGSMLVLLNAMAVNDGVQQTLDAPSPSTRVFFAYLNTYPNNAECADIDRLGPPACTETKRASW